MAYSDYGSTTSVRPDRPLVVKATFDRWNKRITFSSARNCTYELLRGKVEQSFSLSASVFSIAYKDDDGEITDIASESDLTEAIQYFQNGVDDLPVSSAASILSGRSFGGRKITLRVIVTVDYDGPSLSDTSSLVSLDEYKDRNNSDLSLTYSGPVNSEPEDDTVTVSSRDTGLVVKTTKPASSAKRSPDRSRLGSEASSLRSGTYLPPEVRFPEDPSAVFEQLRLANAGTSQFGSPNLGERSAQWLREQKSLTLNAMLGPTPTDVDSDAMTLSDGFSLTQSVNVDEENLDGDLALQQDLRGKFYYSYRTSGSAASQSHDSGYDESIRQEASVGDHEEYSAAEHSQWKPNGTQRHSISVDSCSYPSSSRHSDPFLTGSSVSEEIAIHPDIPLDLLQFMDAPSHPLECTDCSECGVTLDMIRYVCTTCGEKIPYNHSTSSTSNSVGTLESPTSPTSSKGKARDIPVVDTAYPPEIHRTPSTPSSPSGSSSSWVALSDAVSSAFNSNKPLPPPPVPLLPIPFTNGRASSSDPALQPPTVSSSPSSSLSVITLTRVPNGTSPTPEPTSTLPPGYELCANCIQSAGVNHALQGNSGSGPESTPVPAGAAPPSPEEAQRTLSQWRRSAPKQKGHFRHAYVEKVWGDGGWKDVEQDEVEVCSTCETKFSSERYKCASCPKMVICRGCYSQVHEVHPMHPFLYVVQPPRPAQNEPEFPQFPNDDGLGETSMTHPGVVCTHCLREIVGARFHCAICESVDICSNCESAGLPGNLDAPDGGHNSSHIMIKIPVPIRSSEVQTASRRALHLWRDRDEPNAQRSALGLGNFRRQRAQSLQSTDAVTVIGSGRTSHSRLGLGIGLGVGLGVGHGQRGKEDHGVLCRGCATNIVGVRYQCATCPSTAHMQYSLCAHCEPSSYLLHDPMHVFFKLPKPVDCPIESQHPIVPVLYKVPAGPQAGQMPSANPKAYLDDLRHNAALCDQCMDPIQGEWYRCVYCAKDLCNICEALDAHDSRHFFYVFKSSVDMQLFRVFAELDNPGGSPPVLNYRVYYS